MRTRVGSSAALVAASVLLWVAGCGDGGGAADTAAVTPSATAAPAAGSSPRLLPPPRSSGPLSLEEALSARRSVRSYGGAPVTLAEIAQLLWAAQGVTDPETGFRTAPSAGALYPLELYVVAEHVTGLPTGAYRYLPAGHALEPIQSSPSADDLYRAALSQAAVREAPAVLVLAGVYDRTTLKYGERGTRYVHMEAGHAAQNVMLQAAALGLGTVVIGAFDDDVQLLMGMPTGARPLYLMPVGHPRDAETAAGG